MPLSCPIVQGNPINVGTGLKYQIEVDYRAPSGLEFKRTYNSQATYETPSQIALGQGGWGLGWNRSVRGTQAPPPSYPLPINWTVYRLGLGPNWVQDTTIVTAYVTRDDGKTYTYNRSENAWLSDADVVGQLTSQFDATGKLTSWTYTTDDHEIETYNASGQLASVTDRVGQATTLSYSDGTTVAPNGGYVLDAAGVPTTAVLSAGLLIRVTDAYARSLSLGYDSLSRIVKMTDPAGGVFNYGYDTNANLTSVTYPDGKTKQYLYENPTYPHALTGITDENTARYATYAYDSSGRAISTEHAGGAEKVSLIYNPNGTTSITDALNTTRTQTFQTVLGVVKSGGMSQPGGSGCAAASSNLTYDPNGNVASNTDFNGNKTTYTYDLTRNLETSRIEGLSSSGAKTTATRTINTLWHNTYRLPATITEQDTSGASAVTLRTTTLGYDSVGNLLTKTITDAQTPAATRTWTYTYDTLGHRLTVDGPRTDVSDITTYTYDTQGNLASVTNPLGQLTTLSNYTAHGQPQNITDANGFITFLGYDSRQRLLSQYSNGKSTSYTYDAAGQLTQITEPAGHTLTYTYDAAHRLTRITDNLGNKISYTLDLMGNRTKEDVLDPTNTLLRTHNRVYDALNRLQQEYGVTTQLTYQYDPQGNLTAVVDALNQTTRYEYDALSRQIKQTDAAAGITRTSYNALDQLTQVTDPNSVATQYTLNALGDLKQQTSLDSGTTQNSYDAAGNLISRTDAKGQTTTYTYDALNRLARATYPATANSGALQIDYQYDMGTNAIGQLTRVTETENNVVVNTSTYTYNLHNKLDSATRTTPTTNNATISATTSYRYDNQGRLIGLTYPSGRTVDYTLDGIGRISQISTAKDIIPQTVVSTISYLGFDQTPSTYTLGNGRVVNRTTDQEGKLSSYTLSGTIQSLGYDTAARLISRSNAANPTMDYSNYGYDALNRLTGDITPTTTQTYQYDANGNRTRRLIGSATENYAYNPATTGNRLSSVTLGSTLRSLTYDANGSLTTDNAIQYAYDARNRKTLAIANGTTTQYKYDAFGQRIQKSDPQKQTLFYYDQNGKLISESDGQGIPQREYIYLGDKPVAVWE